MREVEELVPLLAVARVPFRQAAGAVGRVVDAIAAAGVATPAVAGHLRDSFTRTPVRGS
jgi:hypothetical protein